MERARLIIDPPAEGAWNMAVDQALLETADKTGLITLRFYQWSKPTLSLGYFQNYKDRELHPPSLKCPLVRRRTGGGAIMHDHELTYSLCVPSTNRWSTKNGELYETIHRIIIDHLKEQGSEAVMYRDLESTSVGETATADVELERSTLHSGGPIVDQNAFMCFRRRSPGDVVLKGRKIVGSAQRRVKSALLQHGSILMEQSQFAPELIGLGELCGFSLCVSKTIEKLTALAENRLRTNLIIGKLSQQEIEAAEKVCSDIFGNRRWSRRR
jgi:lipoate-protein ligase A